MSSLTRVAPELPVRDLPAALEYYTVGLGFEVAAVMPARDYAIVERDGVALHLFTDATAVHTAASLHVFVRDLEELFAEFESRGALVLQGIVMQPWGNREFRIADPTGNILKFTEPVA